MVESPSQSSEAQWRELHADEIRLISALLDRPRTIQLDIPPIDALLAREMQDGGMGSLSLLPPLLDEQAERQMAAELAEIEFHDSDGVLVSATLNVDQYGQLFELDVFKTDFSPLLSIPERFS